MNFIRTNNSTQCAIALEALKQVLDPELGLNIVDLGLVYRIDFFQQEKCIELDMTLTTRFCPMGESITDSVNEVMEETFKDDKIVLNLVFDPRWGHHIISEVGHAFLNS